MDASDITTREPLTFSVMEKRLRALPDLQGGAFRPSRFVKGALVATGIGLLFGLVPSFLLTTKIPTTWLLTSTKFGAMIAIAGLVSVSGNLFYSLVQDILGWVPDQALRMDHQRKQFAEEIQWLRSYPLAEIRNLLEYVRYSDHQRTGRIGLIAGGIDKLGVLPVLVSLFVLFRGGGDPFAVSGWVAALGVLLSILWLICWIATSARGRLRTYEFLLDAAVKVPEHGTRSFPTR